MIPIIWKNYGTSIKMGKGLLNKTFAMRSKRYRGKGRPRKSDYDHKTILEIQRDANILMVKRIDDIWRTNATIN